MILLPKWDKHANIAKIKHNISESQITYTWLFGALRPTRSSCWRLVGERITLILNKKGDFIITMYPNKGNDKLDSILSLKRRKAGELRKMDLIIQIKEI